MTTWWPIARIAAAMLGIAAILRQLTISIGNAVAATDPWAAHLPTVMTNFFSYFTILSNIAAAVALLAGGVWALRHRDSDAAEPGWLTVTMLCASTYMIVTGIVYNLLLRSFPVAGISDVWTNETLHVIIPLVMLADVLFAPRRAALPWKAMLIAAAFPIAWAVYTLVRANFIVSPRTGDAYWYPYPFLDPHITPGGILGVAGYIVGIAAAILAVAAGVIWIGRRRAVSAAKTESATV